MNSGSIGQVKAVLVVEGKGVVTSVHARERQDPRGERVVVTGDVSLSPDVQSILKGRVLGMVDEIATTLARAPSSFELTVQNIGAASIVNQRLTARGRSLDCAVFLALLSASLRLRIRQDTVFTGKIASADGHLAPVSGMPEKIAAVARFRNAGQFVYPDYDEDNSLRSITPEEYSKIAQAISEHSTGVKCLPVRNVLDLTKSAVAEVDVCLATLEAGFYQHDTSSSPSANPVASLVHHLADDSESRFWRSLERCLLEKQFDSARSLTDTFVEHHIQREQYPARFGGKLHHLLISIPPSVKNALRNSPVVGMKERIQISQLATEHDHEDVGLLFKSVDLREPRTIGLKQALPSDEPEPHGCPLQQFLDELSIESITREVLLPIDNARASYVIDGVTVEGHTEFLDSITSFYAHLLRHMDYIAGARTSGDLRAKALALANDAYWRRGGEKAAYIEATSGANGGLKQVFDEMTESLKRKKRGEYIDMVLKSTFDPLDFEGKTAVARTLLRRVNDALPDSVREMEPERLAANVGELAKLYSDSVEAITERLRLL